jgi:hypothetical protein
MNNELALKLFPFCDYVYASVNFNASTKEENMAKLKLNRIKCHSTEDWGGADEVRLKLNDVEVWRSDMNDDDELNLGIVKHFNYSARIDLYDEDTGWFDDDDHLGTNSVNVSDAGKGEKTLSFTGDGANYTLYYEVTTEISVLPEIDIWLEGIEFNNHEDPVTSEYQIHNKITLFGKVFEVEREKHGISSKWKWVPLGWHMGSYAMDFTDLVNNIEFGYYSKIKGIDSFNLGEGGHIGFSFKLDINPSGDIPVTSFGSSETSNTPDQFFLSSFNGTIGNSFGVPRFRIALKIPGHLYSAQFERVKEFIELFNNGLSNVVDAFKPFVVGLKTAAYVLPNAEKPKAQGVTVLTESDTGRNEFFEDDHGRRMSRTEFVNAI